jgi:TolB protein
MMAAKLTLSFAGIIGVALALLVGGMGSAGATWLRGDEIAYVSYHNLNADIFVIDLNHGLTYNLTNDEAYDVAPAWSPDGEWIAFASDRDGRRNIYVMDRFGRGIRRLTNSGGVYTEPRWSSDGQSLIFIALDQAPNGIYSVNFDGDNFRRLDDPGNPGGMVLDLAYDPGDLSRSLSPDGRRLAFMTYRNRAWGIYVSPNTSRQGAELLVDVGRFTEIPVWSPDGTRMAFTAQRDGVIDLFVIDVDGSSTPRRLTFNRELDISPSWRP